MLSKTLTRFVMALVAGVGLFLWLSPRPVDSQDTASAETEGARSLIFAGGCFWCVESDFDKVPGVLATTSGYSGGTFENPTYEDVVRGGTGHYEVVRIDYDPEQIDFEGLLTAFWHSTDPTDAHGQFCDRGMSYATAVFVDGDEERALAESSRQALIDSGFDIVTPILDRTTFYAAEEFHQDYHYKNPRRYNLYRFACGRNAGVNRLWGELAYTGIPR